MTTISLVHGEELQVPERVIVAPALGTFRPEVRGAEGDRVSEGQVVGVVEAGREVVPVRSPFTGLLMGMMAEAGERVRDGQPVAWLRVS